MTMSTPQNLGQLEPVPLREAWRHEANEFTPWLAEPENLGALARALGLSELELVATEHWVGGFKLDILCTEGGEPVVIENQLAETDHKHLGQILTYAAGVGARKVIWVASTFRPEHKAALEFLNANTTDELGFFGVQIELWRIAQSPLAPKFEVVVRPDDWVKTGHEQTRAVVSASPTGQLQQRFWMALVGQLARNAPHIRPHKPQARHWLSNSIGRSGFELNVTANTNAAQLGVMLWMPGVDAKQHFFALLEQKKTIEKQLGFPLDWQELPDAQASRITTWYPAAPLAEESRWPEYLDWIEQRLVVMDRVLRPIVRALP